MHGHGQHQPLRRWAGLYRRRHLLRGQLRRRRPAELRRRQYLYRRQLSAGMDLRQRPAPGADPAATDGQLGSELHRHRPHRGRQRLRCRDRRQRRHERAGHRALPWILGRPGRHHGIREQWHVPGQLPVRSRRLRDRDGARPQRQRLRLCNLCSRPLLLQHRMGQHLHRRCAEHLHAGVRSLAQV